MRHRRVALVIAVALAVPLGACGDDDEEPKRAPAPSQTPSPQDSVGQLPPAFLQCMADQGFAVTSSADIHSAPQEVLQMCFATLHEGAR
jgi:hypothetical protein